MDQLLNMKWKNQNQKKMIEIRYYNQWLDTPNLNLLKVSAHNCGDCFGMDLFCLGLGVAFRISK